MSIQIERFNNNYAQKLSKMIYETIDQLEKERPKTDYQMIRNEDTPEELIKASNEGVCGLQ